MVKFFLESGHSGLRIRGLGKMIIFIPGMWEGAWVFKFWMRLAAERGYQVYALNLPGHNDNSQRGVVGKITMSDYVQYVETFLRQVWVRSEEHELPIIVGHSLGGLIAQILASRGLAKKAVFVTSAPSREVLLWGPVLWTLASTPTYWKNIGCGEALMPTYQHLRKLELNNMDDDLARLIYFEMVSESGTVAWEILTLQISVPAKIPCPVMVIAGEKDRMIVPSVQRKIARRFGVEPRFYANGHMIMLEEGWHRPIEDILEFIDQ